MLKIYTEENGCKVNFVMWPLRVAVSGKTVTPAGATEIMEIIGKDETRCPYSHSTEEAGRGVACR